MTITNIGEISPDTGTLVQGYKYGRWNGDNGVTNGDGLMNGRIASVAVGTGASAIGLDSTGIYRTFDTAATINSLSGLQQNIVYTRRILNPFFKTAIYLNHKTETRIFAGFVASASAPASSADPLNVLEGVGLWFDSAVSANWKRMHNDNSGTSTVDDTTVSADLSTLYTLKIHAESDTKFVFDLNDVSVDISTNIPASTTDLAWRIYIENTTGASRTFRIYYVTTRSDK